MRTPSNPNSADGEDHLDGRVGSPSSRQTREGTSRWRHPTRRQYVRPSLRITSSTTGWTPAPSSTVSMCAKQRCSAGRAVQMRRSGCHFAPRRCPRRRTHVAPASAAHDRPRIRPRRDGLSIAPGQKEVAEPVLADGHRAAGIPAGRGGVSVTGAAARIVLVPRQGVPPAQGADRFGVLAASGTGHAARTEGPGRDRAQRARDRRAVRDASRPQRRCARSGSPGPTPCC
jgi:hypothetical protein